MAIAEPAVNENHTPSPHEERVLEVLKLGREDPDTPWGFATPGRVASYHGIPNQRVTDALDRLTAAGWVEQVRENGDPIRGLYRFVGDPREDGDQA